MLRNGQDAALVLGHTPALALPEARGEAMYTNGGAVKAVQLDRLTDQAGRPSASEPRNCAARTHPPPLGPGVVPGFRRRLRP
jgi:hypothetical protein